MWTSRIQIPEHFNRQVEGPIENGRLRSDERKGRKHILTDEYIILQIRHLFVIAKVLNKLNYLVQFRFIVGISSDRFVHVDVVEFEVQSVDQTVDWFIWKKSEFSIQNVLFNFNL